MNKLDQYIALKQSNGNISHNFNLTIDNRQTRRDGYTTGVMLTNVIIDRVTKHYIGVITEESDFIRVSKKSIKRISDHNSSVTIK